MRLPIQPCMPTRLGLGRSAAATPSCRRSWPRPPKCERLRGDLRTALELAAEDDSFADEAASLQAQVDAAEAKLRELLLPKDPNDSKDVILEIKAGEGGEESALFASDLLRMYTRYAERQGWAFDVLDLEATDLGGVKSATVAVRARRPDQAVWRRLKYEGGVHRVQRVPATESQGRIHTSAAGVLVFPEAEEVEVELDPNDLRVDVFRSSGPGGQSVNTTDSAVRITHLPTGTVVSMQNEKSQLQNREAGLRVLRARLLAAAQEEADAAAADARRSQVRTVDRSERVRTYNFPENRISDHRVGFKAYNLDQVLDGALDDVIDALTEADTAALLRGEPAPVTAPRTLLTVAVETLSTAGVPAARADAEQLLAAALGVPRTRLAAVETVDAETAVRFAELVDPPVGAGATPAPRRHRRVPLRRDSGGTRRVRAETGDRVAGGCRSPSTARQPPSDRRRPVRWFGCARARGSRRGAFGDGVCRRALTQRAPLAPAKLRWFEGPGRFGGRRRIRAYCLS